MPIHPIEGSFFKEPSRARHGSLKFLFTLSNLFGVLPFDKNCETSLLLRIYSVIVVWSVVIIGAFLTIYVLYFNSPPSTNSLTFPLLFIIQEILQSLLWVVHSFCLLVYKNRFQILIKNVGEWSIIAKTLKFSSYWTAIGMIFLPVYYLASCLLEDVLVMHDWLFTFYFVKYFKELGTYLMLVQFCAFLEVIEKQLDHTTQMLSKTTTLEAFTEKHHQLICSAACINDIYSWQLLILCTLHFINFVSWLFYAMQDVLIDSEAQMLPFRLFYCSWQLLNIYLVAGSCERIVEKAEDFNTELFRIMRESNYHCNNQKLNLYVTMKQSVNFTACGFFSLGYPLVTSVISSATTYLVILVQFSMPSA